ncbi:OmpA family protein [bacterium]|nr:OmpA family protein [bacterium]
MKLLPFLFGLSMVFGVFTKGFSQTTEANIIALVTNFKDVPQQGERIWFIAKKSGKTYKAVSNATGQFAISLPGPDVYEIKIKAIGDAQDYSTIEIPKLEPGKRYGTMKLTIKFELPKLFTLNNVFFDTGKSSLKPSSYTELDDLAELMTLKPNMQIEVGGHTDSIGSEKSNFELSEARANAVRNYLVKKGIDGNRIVAVGYGETMPVADNGTADGRQQNRRTEVRIIKK